MSMIIGAAPTRVPGATGAASQQSGDSGSGFAAELALASQATPSGTPQDAAAAVSEEATRTAAGPDGALLLGTIPVLPDAARPRVSSDAVAGAPDGAPEPDGSAAGSPGVPAGDATAAAAAAAHPAPGGQLPGAAAATPPATGEGLAVAAGVQVGATAGPVTRDAAAAEGRSRTPAGAPVASAPAAASGPAAGSVTAPATAAGVDAPTGATASRRPAPAMPAGAAPAESAGGAPATPAGTGQTSPGGSAAAAPAAAVPPSSGQPLGVELPAQVLEAAAAVRVVGAPSPAPGDAPAPSAAGEAIALPDAAAPTAQAVRTEVSAATGAAPRAAAPPLSEQLAKPLFTLRTAPSGDHVMSVQVTPENVGPVTVRAHVGTDGIRIELIAPNEQAREALRGMLTDLKRDLAAGGMTASLDISPDDQPAGGRDSASERREQPGRQAAFPGAVPVPTQPPAEAAGARIPTDRASRLDVVV